MSGFNRRRGRTSAFDVKQVLFMVIGLVVGAGVIFVAGLQVGEKLDSAGFKAFSEEESPVAAAMGKKRSAPTLDNFSFYADLDEPAQAPRRRKLYMPQGNANNAGKPALARRELARLKRKARRESARMRSLARQQGSKVKEKVAAVKKSPSVVPNVLGAVGQTGVKQEEAEPVAKAVVAPSERFTLQVGSFDSYEAAASLAGQLRGKGQTARVVLTNAAGARVYRVRVGRFDSREDALKNLRSTGVKGSVVRL